MKCAQRTKDIINYWGHSLMIIWRGEWPMRGRGWHSATNQRPDMIWASLGGVRVMTISHRGVGGLINTRLLVTPGRGHDDSKCGVVWCPGVITQIHQRPSEEVMLARMQRTHQTFTNNNFVYRVINPIHHPAQVTAAQGAAVRDWFLEIFSPKHKLFSICIY